MRANFSRVFALIAAAVLPALAHAGGVQIKMAKNTPRLQLFQGDGTNFMLVDPLSYLVVKTNKTITVPAGFVTDFASVPWYARSVISVLGKHSIPAIVHDYLYWEQRCTREEADAIMIEAMREYGSSTTAQNIVHYSITYGAQGAWDENKADRAKGLIKVLGPDASIPLNIDWDQYRQDLFKEGVKEPPIEPGTPDYCKL